MKIYSRKTSKRELKFFFEMFEKFLSSQKKFHKNFKKMSKLEKKFKKKFKRIFESERNFFKELKNKRLEFLSLKNN